MSAKVFGPITSTGAIHSNRHGIARKGQAVAILINGRQRDAGHIVGIRLHKLRIVHADVELRLCNRSFDGCFDKLPVLIALKAVRNLLVAPAADVFFNKGDHIANLHAARDDAKARHQEIFLRHRERVF